MSTKHVGHGDILSSTHLGTSCLKLSEVVELCRFDDLRSLNILHNTTVPQLWGRLTRISWTEITLKSTAMRHVFQNVASTSASGSPVEEKQTRMCCNPAIVKRRSVTTQICCLRKVLAKFNTYHVILGNLGLENSFSVQGEMHHPSRYVATKKPLQYPISLYWFNARNSHKKSWHSLKQDVESSE